MTRYDSNDYRPHWRVIRGACAAVVAGTLVTVTLLAIGVSLPYSIPFAVVSGLVTGAVLA